MWFVYLVTTPFLLVWLSYYLDYNFVSDCKGNGIEEQIPRSNGCVTHAAKQLALPPNQNGYLTFSRSYFLRWAASLAFSEVVLNGIMMAALLSPFHVAFRCWERE